MADEDELVPVMVPRRHLSAVYRFIGGLDAEATSEGVSGAPQPNWTPALLRRMYTESTVSQQAVLKYLAGRPAESVTVLELVKVLPEPTSGRENDEATLNGVIGALGRRVVRHYGMMAPNKTALMPYETSWDGILGYVYRMSHEVAEVLAAL
jgi:hypothetical protein